MLDSSKKTIATLAAAACLGAGSYAIAANSSTGTSSAASTATQSAPAQGAQQQGQPPQGTPPGQNGQQPTGVPPRRSDETLLTGDAAAKAKAAAAAKLPGATIVRVETDADSGGKYEAHVTTSDGSPATVLMDADFNVTTVLDH